MQTELAGGLILSIMAGALVWLAVIMTRLHNALVAPTVEQRLARLRAQTAINEKMLDDSEVRGDLARFALSEAAILGFFVALEERSLVDDEAAIDVVVEETKRDAPGALGWARKWFSEHRGELAKALLGKINGLVKTVGGGGG